MMLETYNAWAMSRLPSQFPGQPSVLYWRYSDFMSTVPYFVWILIHQLQILSYIIFWDAHDDDNAHP